MLSESSDDSKTQTETVPKSRCFWLFAGTLALLATPVWIGIINISRAVIISEKGWQASKSDELISYEEAKEWFWNSNISNYGWRFYCRPVNDSHQKKHDLFEWKESRVSQWTPYLIFCLSGTWICFATPFLSYARSCELQERNHAVPSSMLVTCVIAGICFQLMAALPANMIMLEGVKWLGCSHLLFAGLGFVFALVHHAIHLKTAWRIMRIELRIFFIACLVVVPPCLVRWRIGCWKPVPQGCISDAETSRIVKIFQGNSEATKAEYQNVLKLRLDSENELESWRPGSLYEWIAATTLFFYFAPYALWFFKKASQTREPPEKGAGQLVTLLDLEVVV